MSKMFASYKIITSAVWPPRSGYVRYVDAVLGRGRQHLVVERLHERPLHHSGGEAVRGAAVDDRRCPRVGVVSGGKMGEMSMKFNHSY